MGGSNSGRWAGYVRKRLVEETPAFDLTNPAVKRALEGPLPVLLRTEWTPQSDDQPALECRVLLAEFTPGRRRLWFVREDDQIAGEESRDPEPVELESVAMGFAPPRWFARCSGCQRRMWKVYVLDDRVACWRCAGLTHRSAQTHDQRVDRVVKGIRRADEAVLAELQRGAAMGGYARIARGKLFFKALDKVMGRA
jgi:hypothetical protein